MVSSLHTIVNGKQAMSFNKYLRLLGFLLLALSIQVLAAPPSHAPAHGWRKKHDPYYEGYSGKRWQDDYGITAGRCDARQVASAMGRAAGTAVSDAIGGEEGEVIGTIAGVLLESRANREMDEIDRGCISHALDLAPDDKPVKWRNDDTDRDYSFIPRAVRSLDNRLCRDLDWGAGILQTACINSDGSWEILSR